MILTSDYKPFIQIDFLPGDVVYFKNPDFNPYTPEWKGLNAVVLDDGTYFAHGIGIGTAEQFIHILNQMRKPWSNSISLYDRLSCKTVY